MSDQRIHLLIESEYDSFNCGIYFPHLTIQEGLLIDPLDKRELKGLEALVQSLVKGDRYIAKDFETKFGQTCLTCNHHRSEYIMKEDWICHDCKKYNKKAKNIHYEGHPDHFDSKLKVTFGSGTYHFDCAEIKELCPDDCNNCSKKQNQIIEPLTPIKQLCDELGIEVAFQ